MAKIIYDCDPGVDDALALLLGLNSREVEFYGITTVHGNVPLEKTTLNVCRILDYLGLDIPVARGMEKPLKAELINAASIHGSDGLGDTGLLPCSSRRPVHDYAVEFMLDGVGKGITTIVATGPLTNISEAFRRNPDVMAKLERLVVMGGAFHMPGNIDRLSEFNFYVDPDAADYVLQQRVRKVLVPLNVTHKVIMTEEATKKLPDTDSGRLAKSVVRKYQEVYMKNSGFPGNPLHDPLAMGYVINPGFLELKPMNVRVEYRGEFTRGVCVPEERPWMKAEPNAEVATGVDGEGFIKYFLSTISR